MPGTRFTWSDDLQTGLNEIDLQHKVLLGQFNDLLDACAEQRGREVAGRFLTFLVGYVNLHFAAEEKLMAEHQYTGLAHHAKEHEEYRAKLDRLRKERDAHGMSDELLREAVWLAADWFLTHIRQTDMAMAGAIRSGK